MITAPALEALDRISHGFLTRQGGVSQGIYESLNIGLGSDDERDLVKENRQRVASRFGLTESDLVTPHQHHSADVIHVTEAPWPGGKSPKGDAVVTDRPGILLGIATADCGPVLFADNEAGVVAAAHSGWRGAFTGILEATVTAMTALGAKRENIHAVLGPTISAAAYEVGPEFVDRFAEADASTARYFRPSEKPGHSMFDLPAYILTRLGNAGIAHAENLDLCTYADEDRFFSYRRTTHRNEPDYGRLISVITLRPEA